MCSIHYQYLFGVQRVPVYAKIPSIDVVCKFVADGNMDLVRTAITSIIHEADNPQGLFYA